jgi:hypothetical protein
MIDMRQRFFTAVFVLAITVPGASAQAPLQRKGAERLAAATQLRPLHPSETPYSVRSSDAPIQIRVGPARGWERAFTISNGQVEALVIPEIGRIMQFQFAGEDAPEGPFWEDPSLHGQSPNPASGNWINFGGDKTWPAPQADWGKVTPREWPPPVAFDSMPVEVSVRRDALVLTSPIDPHYGIRAERVIDLALDGPVMTVTTTYRKVTGRPLEVGVWIITQLRDPIAVFAPVPADSRFPDGYVRQSGERLPAGFKVENSLLSLARDTAQSTKIGMDADRLLWVGPTQMLLIRSPRIHGASYPDHGSSAEIYTNPDPRAYVELETLGPLHRLDPGQSISQTNTYTLLRRTEHLPALDARKILFRN